MVIKQLSLFNCKQKLKEFIEDLFVNWKEESSFCQDNILFPQRAINEITEKIDLTDGTQSEVIFAFDEKSEEICGMLYITFNSDKSAHISLLNVKPRYRKMNVGFSLYSYLMILAVNKGIDYIMF